MNEGIGNVSTGAGMGIDEAVLRTLAGTDDGVTVRLVRGYSFPVADVWSAWTEPERLRRWFAEVGGDLTPGGTVWMWSSVEGEGGRATIRRCEPPRLLEVAWSYGDEAPSRVRLDLTPDPVGGTVLTLEHWGPAGFEGAQYGAGWEAFLVAAAAHLATGAGDPADPEWAALEQSLRPAWDALGAGG